MATQWVARFYFFIRLADLTPEVRKALAAAFSDNGSGESSDSELLMFNGPRGMSISGAEPAQIVAFNTAATASIQSTLITLLNALPQARYYVVDNATDPARGRTTEKLVASDSPGAQERVGDIFKWNDAEDDLYIERGLLPIKPAPPVQADAETVKPDADTITPRR